MERRGEQKPFAWGMKGYCKMDIWSQFPPPFLGGLRACDMEQGLIKSF